MNRLFTLLALSLLLLLVPSAAYAQDAPAAAEATTGLGSLIWAFVNSPLGVSIVSGALLWIISRVLTAKPAWEEHYMRYRGLFFDAVRHAETAIPDNTTSSAGQKADLALKFLLKLEGPVTKAREKDLRRAVEQAVVDGAKAKAKAQKGEAA